MSRIAYANRRYVPIQAPAVRIEDRGLQFADGVYEVIKCVSGRVCDLERHLDRLERSLAALAIPMPTTRAALNIVIRSTLRRNRLRDALIYLQVDRGVAPRNHVYTVDLRPTLIVTVRRSSLPKASELSQGVGVITLPDQRWKRCDIKSVSLLANVQARQQAADAGCCVTRQVVLELAQKEGIKVLEQPFTVAEAKDAREAFLTSTSSLVLPVTAIDGRTVANGMPGSITSRLLDRYREHLVKAA